MNKSIERFKELTMLDGTSGFEREVSKYLEKNYLSMLMKSNLTI